MGHLHAQVQTTKKAGGALPPLRSGVMQAPAWKPETVFTHMLDEKQLQCQPSNALVIMKITGWLRGIILNQIESFNLK